MASPKHLVGGLLFVVAGAVALFANWPVPKALTIPIAIALGIAGLASAIVGIGRPPISETRITLIEGVTLLAFAALGALIAVSTLLATQGPSSYLLGFLWSSATLFAVWMGITTLREVADNR